jgi:hypothetical protein
MDLGKVLTQLRSELENLDAAIASLERIQQGGRRRGRPPEWLNRTRETRTRAARADAEEPKEDRRR